MADKQNRYFDLSHFALVHVSGADAEGFLQNQLTADMKQIDRDNWALSAWCLPNGRVVCNFILYRSDSGFMLVLPSMLKENFIRKLSMYVLRAKVNVADVDDEYTLLGLSGENIDNLTDEFGLKPDQRKVTHTENITSINFQDTTPRVLLIIKNEQLDAVMKRVLIACQESNRACWSLLDIESGIPWITSATTETHLPQMLNLDLSGGLSLKKGCYPGQEVIARMHFRGETKKRLYLGTGKGSATPGPGDELENAEDNRKIGGIIDAETDVDEHFMFLAVADVDLKGKKPAIRDSQCEIVQLTPLFDT